MEVILNPDKNQKKIFSQMIHEEWEEDFSLLEHEYLPQIVLGIANQEVVAGMALFVDRVPEGKQFDVVIHDFAAQSAVYLGYLVTKKSHRGQGIGSQFLQDFFHKTAYSEFWLVVEDAALEQFYLKNGCRFFAQIGNEKIFVFEK